jgi:RimJ/RimL family protein N-acetyltransferase
MHKITGNSLLKLVPLLDNEPLDYPITKGVLDGTFSGYAIVDDPKHPTKAMVFHTHIGFAHYLGSCPCENEIAEYTESVIKYRSDRKYCNWIEIAHCPNSVTDLVTEKIPDMKKYNRISWNHDASLWKNTPAPSVPDGCKIVLINNTHFKNTFVRHETEMFWDSTDIFLEKAMGTIALDKRGKFMGVCAAVSDSDDFYEINIEVSKKHRRRGIGYAVAHRYIAECYNRTKKPHWDCFEHNSASRSLASKLGFVESGRYPLVSWTYQI